MDSGLGALLQTVRAGVREPARLDDRAVSSTTSLAILLAVTAVLALAVALVIFAGP